MSSSRGTSPGVVEVGMGRVESLDDVEDDDNVGIVYRKQGVLVKDRRNARHASSTPTSPMSPTKGTKGPLRSIRSTETVGRQASENDACSTRTNLMALDRILFQIAPTLKFLKPELISGQIPLGEIS